MYTFSSKLKTFSFILMIIGIIGIGYGFMTMPTSIEDIEALEAKEHAAHGNSHAATAHESAAAPHHNTESVPMTTAAHHKHAADAVAMHSVVADTATAFAHADKIAVDTASQGMVAEVATVAHTATMVVKPVDAHAAHQKHLTHKLHQLQNKPWAALYIPILFLMLISLGVLAFYAIQNVAQAGWSPVLFRVMQGITAYLPVASVIFFIFLLICAVDPFHNNHLFAWMHANITDKTAENYDKLMAGKQGYLNIPFWLFRAAFFLAGWNLYRYFSRKNCLAQDDASDNAFYKKNFNYSAGFLVFFIVTESIMSWDWIMSIDHHWFSTLFGWYVFASFIVSGVTTICMVTLYLKSKGHLEYVNTSHIHDLAKFMFGFSVFWTYLWFSQFMLIWYANIPEEITYFKTRIDIYTLPFWGAVIMNFIFPILILINTEFKRITWVLVMAGVVILLGHYVDFFNMIMPGTVGDSWYIGVSEISSLLFFVGLFIFVVFSALTKAPLLAKRNPFIEESKHFHY